MLIFEYVCPQTHSNFWNISPDLHQVYKYRSLAALKHPYGSDSLPGCISPSTVLVLWCSCIAALLQKKYSSRLRSHSDNHRRYTLFRYKFLVKIWTAKILQSKCNPFQLKVELISWLLQHWSQFSSMPKILYAAQEKDRTLHMAQALIYTPFKIPACWSENWALRPEQGIHQQGERFADAISVSELAVQFCWFASQWDAVHYICQRATSRASGLPWKFCLTQHSQELNQRPRGLFQTTQSCCSLLLSTGTYMANLYVGLLQVSFSSLGPSCLMWCYSPVQPKLVMTKEGIMLQNMLVSPG